MIKRSKQIHAAVIALAITASSTQTMAGGGAGNIVYDPTHHAETLAQIVKDQAAWDQDFLMSEYRNLASAGSNSAELLRTLAELRNSEISPNVSNAIKDLIAEVTLGVLDLDVDIGDIVMNEDMLLEIMTEKLAETLAYKEGISSRTEDVGAVIVERYPELDYMLDPASAERWYSQTEEFHNEIMDVMIRTQYDSASATMQANTALQEGLRDADAMLAEVRADVLNEGLGENAMIRRIMKTSLVGAEHARATAEAVTMLTDLQAQEMLKEASQAGATRGASDAITTISTEEMTKQAEYIRSKSDPDNYWKPE